MISIGATALTFLDRATKVTGMATNIKSWVKDMLPTQHKEVRLLLGRLCCRIDAITRPLQYCWLWATDKESCVSDTVYHCRKTLLRVEKFISSLVQESNGRSSSSSSSSSSSVHRAYTKEEMLQELRNHLSDLDFCVQSLSLSLHIISSTQQQHQQQHQLNKPLSSPRGSVSVSPSCLLKASSRVVEMHTTGGDVATASGVLYRRTPASHVSPVNRCPNPATGQPAPTMRGGGWMVYMQWAKWSVHHELKTHKYSLVIQDLHPIQPSPSRVASSSSSSTPLLRTHTYNTNASRTNRQVSSSRHHRGDASDEEDDATSSFVNYIPTSSGKSSVNHRDGSILGAVSRRFSADSPGSSSSSSSPSSSLVFELETSLRFRLIAPGDLKDSQNASSSSSSSSSSGERKGQGHYHNDDNGAEAKERGFVNVSTATLQGRHKHQHGDKRGHSDNNGDSNSKSSHMAFSSSSAVAESPAAAASSSSSSSSSSSFLRAKRSGIAKIIKPLEHAEGFIWEKKVANVVQYEYAFLLDTAASTGLETALDSRGGVSGRGLPNERLADGNSSSSTSTSASKTAKSRFRIPQNTRQGRGGGDGLAVTTLLYIARLCIYENFAGKFITGSEATKGIASRLQSMGEGCREPRAQSHSSNQSPMASRTGGLDPLHTYASDEELTFLLKSGVIPAAN